MVLAAYFILAWVPPDPPIPEYGVELSFGLVESAAPAQAENNQSEESEPVDESQSEEIEAEESPEEIVEEVPEERLEQIEAPQEDSPDVVEEEVVEEVKEKEPEKVPEKTPKKETTEETQTEDNKEQKKEEATETDTQKKDSKGDGKGEGEQGDPESKIDERALYGKKGSGDLDGASLEMTGWAWDTKPNPNDKSSETGKIVYQIKIDSYGYIVEINVVTSTVTPSVEKIYRNSIEGLTFSRTSDYNPAPFSTGTITFIIKSK